MSVVRVAGNEFHNYGFWIFLCVRTTEMCSIMCSSQNFCYIHGNLALLVRNILGKFSDSRQLRCM